MGAADLSRLHKKAPLVWLGLLELARKANAKNFFTTRDEVVDQCGLRDVDSVMAILKCLHVAGYLDFKRNFVDNRIRITIWLQHPAFEVVVPVEAGAANG
jgi:hypothetical protein